MNIYIFLNQSSPGGDLMQALFLATIEKKGADRRSDFNQIK